MEAFGVNIEDFLFLIFLLFLPVSHLYFGCLVEYIPLFFPYIPLFFLRAHLSCVLFTLQARSGDPRHCVYPVFSPSCCGNIVHLGCKKQKKKQLNPFWGHIPTTVGRTWSTLWTGCQLFEGPYTHSYLGTFKDTNTFGLWEEAGESYQGPESANHYTLCRLTKVW